MSEHVPKGSIFFLEAPCSLCDGLDSEGYAHDPPRTICPRCRGLGVAVAGLAKVGDS